MMSKLEYPRKAGIYKFTCKNNGKIYIGKSVNIRIRINRHRIDMKHLNTTGLFQRALIKHGWDLFDIDILEVIEPFDKSKDRELLLELETRYMKLFNSTDRNVGYNICEYSTDRTGHKCSEETRERMSKARVGHKCSEETKEKMRNRIYSEETRERMRQRKLGNKMSDETKEKIRKTRLGKTLSEESKKKLSRSRTGIIFSKEHKEKLGLSKKGKTFSEEHKQKLKQAKKTSTYKHSEETKIKIGKASKGRNTRKKIYMNKENELEVVP